MSIAFCELPDTARLWIYQGLRKLTNSEVEHVQVESKKFVGKWRAHDQPLKADAIVVKDQFLVLAVDESFSLASGCSIDASVNLMRKFNTVLSVDFLNRKNVAFMINDEVKIYPFSEIADLVKKKVIKKDTLIFNNMVKDLGEWRAAWIIPCGESWFKKYFH